MRWPLSLLFRGDRDAPVATGDAGAAEPGAPGVASSPAGPASAVARPAAWSSLPPVQRAAGDMALTAPTAAFVRDLAGHRPPEPILRPLAHDLAADGPAGLVSGIATPLAAHPAPVAGPAGHPELPRPRGVQRRAGKVTATPLPASEVEDSTTDAPPLAVAGVGATDFPALRPPRALAVVAPSAAAPALAATRVGASTAPETARAIAPASGAASSSVAGSPVQRSTETQIPPSASPPIASPPILTSPPVASPPTASPPIAPSSGPDAAPDGTQPTPGADAPATRPVLPRSLGESRRLGLGAPLAGRPNVQRVAAGPDLPVARAGRTATPPIASAAVPPPLRAAAAEGALPVLRVVPEDRGSATPPEPEAERSDDGATAAPPATLVDAETRGDLAGPATTPVQRSGERPLVGETGRRVAISSSGDTAAAPPGGVEPGGGDTGGAEPGGVEPGEGLPLAVGTGIDGGWGAPGDAQLSDSAGGPQPDIASTSAQAVSGSPSAGQGEMAPPALPSAAPPAPLSAAPAVQLSAAPAVQLSAAPPAPLSAAPAVQLSAAPPAPPERSVPLVIARSLRGAAPLRPGPGAPAGPPPHATLGTGGAAPGPGDVARAFAAAPTPGEPTPGMAASWWPVAQRSAAEDVESPTSPDARSRTSSLPVARPAAAALPFGTVAAGRSGAGAGAVSEPVAVSRLADGGGSLPPPSADALGWSAGSGFGVLPASGPPVVQRAVNIDEMVIRAGAAPAAGGAEGGTGGAGAAGAGQDYEEIADRVYDRIRSRFATELLLDRERMGLLIDG